ncbi:MAG: hypothetical protein WBW38_16890 [Candidatus Sulfotelmatobacter sp.]
MSQISGYRLTVAICLLAFAAVVPRSAQDSISPKTAVDSTLFTTYSGNLTSVNWVVCGSTAETEGCYASGSLGPFVGVGAMLESNPSVKGDVVTREIYVVDSGSADSVKLYVYKKTDTVSTETDTVVVTLAKTVTLPLTGGSTALCSMAANSKFLFIGTNQSNQAVEVKKSTFAMTEIGGFSPPSGVTSITSDQYGYVTVTQGDAFTVLGPDGSFQEDGGGTDFMLGTTQAVSSSVLLGSGDVATPQLGVRPKGSGQAEAK